MKLVFATNNKHKVNEIKEKLRNKINIVSLKDIGFEGEIEESYETLEENAAQKAIHIYNQFKIDCFADDTGLEIEALNGDPGVYSARYAGGNCTYDDNMNKVLLEMKEIKNRNARFRTVIAFVEKGTINYFEGLINGKILTEKRGINGFGYDPIFIPDGYEMSFAEMDLTKKNTISHRALAIEKLVKYIYEKY